MAVGNPAYLVIGKDGLIGRRAFDRLRMAGQTVIGTSRRQPLSPDTIRLDLACAPGSEFPPPGIDLALFCASATNIQACEDDPATTRQVNLTNTLAVIERLIGQGTFVVYLSSSAVFDGETPFPDENAPTQPTTEYGRQKAEVEARLLDFDGAADGVCVVRLTKVLAPELSLIQRFHAQLRGADPVEAYEDLALSPISSEYAVDSVLRILNSRTGGIRHLSGADEISYAAFASALACMYGFDPQRIRPVRGRPVLYRPRHPALGMRLTEGMLGIGPQPLRDALLNLLG